MRTEAAFSPMWAVPPGQTISDLLTAKHMSSEQLAQSMRLSTDDLDGLLVGNNALTAEVACRLEDIFGVTAAFWLRREEQYREQLAQLHRPVDPADHQHKAWLKSLPLKDMCALGWLEAADNASGKLLKCLEFFNVPNLNAWNRIYGRVNDAVAFRTTKVYMESGPATAAWLRQGEIQSDRIACRDWNPRLFEQQLAKIRALTLVPQPSEFIPKLQRLCAEAGVAVAIVRAPTGCRASGATFFSTQNKAVLLLSFRYLSDDQFWFSFFHEAGHLVLHWDPDSLILETSDVSDSPIEQEANHFAATMLLPDEFQRRLPEAAGNLKDIMRLARDAGVSSGIVVGQMQHQGLVKREHFNKLKIRYRWT